MKHIKTFEDRLPTNFKIGDYIKLKDSFQSRWNVHRVIKILDIDERDSKYILEIIIFQDDVYKVLKNKTISMSSNFIQRLATPEEIEEFKSLLNFIKNIEKYNL